AGLVLIESLGLAFTGAILGLGLALLAQGRSTAALTSAAVFPLHVGLIGGLFPSYLAKRMDLLRGLRG
ncbi:MAG TPA: hypothetical protein VGM39_01305, partial [Kofleriaceae bacterium]